MKVTLAKSEKNIPKKCEGENSNGFHIKYSATRTIVKMKILGVVLELTPKRHWQSSLFTSKLGQIGQIGSTVIAGSFKMAPRIFIF